MRCGWCDDVFDVPNPCLVQAHHRNDWHGDPFPLCSGCHEAYKALARQRRKEQEERVRDRLAIIAFEATIGNGDEPNQFFYHNNWHEVPEPIKEAYRTAAQAVADAVRRE